VVEGGEMPAPWVVMWSYDVIICHNVPEYHQLMGWNDIRKRVLILGRNLEGSRHQGRSDDHAIR
jgi:hypothetical protein